MWIERVEEGLSDPKKILTFTSGNVARRLFELSPALYRRYREAKVENVYGFRAPPDPFKLIPIDPTDVQEMMKQDIYHWNHEHSGRIVGGSWDRETHTIESHFNYRIKYVSLVERFDDGLPWKETERYSYEKSRAKEASHAEILANLSRYDRLFEDIQRRYRTSFEIPEANFLEEICVSIERDGEILFTNSGWHRLAIARILGLETIPVRVMWRHEKWQAIREQLYQHTSRNVNPPDRLQKYSGHPDLEDVTNY